MTGFGVSAMVGFKLLLLVVVLGLTAGHALICAVRLWHTDQFPALLTCAIISVLLLAVLPVARVYSSSWRAIAKESGVYESRRPVQRVITVASVVGFPLLGGIGALWLRRSRWSLIAAVILSFLLLCLALVKIVSYHSIDQVMNVRIVPGISLFELSFSIGILGLNACLVGFATRRQVI